MNGRPVPLQFCLFRELTYHWKKTRSGLIRFHDEEENDGSPRIVCTQENDSMQFAIDTENGVVLKDLSFNDAIAAFYQLKHAVPKEWRISCCVAAEEGGKHCGYRYVTVDIMVADPESDSDQIRIHRLA
jgi:hypothetical protein